MAFLPDGRLLVTEKKGTLLIVGQDGVKSGVVSGLPDVDYGGQGGLGDVAIHPDFAANGLIYLSYVEGGPGGTRGAAVMRAVLNATERPYLSDAEVIWRQYPKLVGYGHYGHRLLFDADGYLFISSGDRQKFTPAQDMQSNIGKVLRLRDDGSVPQDNPFVDYLSVNPFVDDDSVYQQIWSLGHRNPLGIAFDLNGQLWEIEHGPAGGDELNRIVRGGNYGYPIVSNGDHYDGREIPDHDTRPEFLKPAVWWTPVISPKLIICKGCAEWRGDARCRAFVGHHPHRTGRRKQREAERYPWAHARCIVKAGGTLWVLEDE
jgi:glucose/arabinose dehydrogenase